MFKEGDIVEIPLPDGRTAIGWILHISQRTKNAVGFVVLGIKGQLREDVVRDAASGKPKSMKVLGLLYTNISALKPYGWKTFAHQPMSESARMLTKRDVGGNVYIGDEYIGPNNDPKLQRMVLCGVPGWCEDIVKAFPPPDRHDLEEQTEQ